MTLFPPLPPLWPHQLSAIECAGSRHALFFDPGLGKTRVAVELVRRSRETRVLVIAPLNVCRMWDRELPALYGEEWETYIVAGGTPKEKQRTVAQFTSSYSRHPRKLLIVNQESVRTKRRKVKAGYRATGPEENEILERLKLTKVNFVIVDESHNFKTPSSAQTKGLMALEEALRPQYFYMLTGTPAPQGEMDLWSTLFLMRETRDDFFIWRKRHFADLNERMPPHVHFPKFVITPKGRERIQASLEECSSVARKTELQNLPDLLRSTMYSEMTVEQRRQYETMLEFLFAVDSEGNTLTAANLLSRTLRLQQILAGFLGEIELKENPRLDAFCDAVDKTDGEQFLVWTIFAGTYSQLGKILQMRGITHGYLTGEQSSEDRAKTIDAFQAGKLRAIIGHPRAGGVGVNLQAASYSIHYTRSFSLVDDIQAEARNHRGGSKHTVCTRIDIVTPDSIDEQIVAALAEKKTVQDFILDLKREHGRDEKTEERAHGTH